MTRFYRVVPVVLVLTVSLNAAPRSGPNVRPGERSIVKVVRKAMKLIGLGDGVVPPLPPPCSPGTQGCP